MDNFIRKTRKTIKQQMDLLDQLKELVIKVKNKPITSEVERLKSVYRFLEKKIVTRSFTIDQKIKIMNLINEMLNKFTGFLEKICKSSKIAIKENKENFEWIIEVLESLKKVNEILKNLTKNHEKILSILIRKKAIGYTGRLRLFTQKHQRIYSNKKSTNQKLETKSQS